MRITQITGTKLFASALCMGTGDMGAGTSRELSYRLLDQFSEAGGNFLDSAKVYSDWIPGERSRSEKVIGEWMKLRKNRSQIIVGTKGAHFNLDTPQIQRVSPEEITSDLEASLQHLQTDYIDMYWLHRDDPNRPVADIVDTLEGAARAGKIRYYGFSNWTLERIILAQNYARERSYQGCSAIQNLWNLASINKDGIADPTMIAMDADLWGYHRENQLTAIPYTSQAGGLFQKISSAGINPLSKNLRKIYLNPVTERRAQKVIQLAQETGLSVTQIVMGYLLSQPFPTIPVFSVRNEDQLADTLQAADIILDSDQVEFLLAE